MSTAVHCMPSSPFLTLTCLSPSLPRSPHSYHSLPFLTHPSTHSLPLPSSLPSLLPLPLLPPFLPFLTHPSTHSLPPPSLPPFTLILQLSELQKKSNELKREVDETYQLAENLVVGGMGKQQYLERERNHQAHLNRLQNEIDTIVQGFGL